MIGRLKNWLAEGGLLLLLELALVAALGAVLAHWTWAALTPRALAPSALEAPAQTRAAAMPVKPHLFGAAPGSAAPASGTKLRLVGVLSPGARGAGRAIFALENGRSRSAGVGETISAGFVLQEVHADHVLVSHDGTLERFRLDRRARR